MRRAVMVGLISGVLTGCAPGAPTTTTGSSTGPIPVAGRKTNVISREEIAAAQAENPSAYDLILHLRPSFLKNRGVTSPGAGTSEAPVVYVDNVRFGGLEALTQITSKSLFSIQYLSGADATTRYGMDHGGGAILVFTR